MRHLWSVVPICALVACSMNSAGPGGDGSGPGNPSGNGTADAGPVATQDGGGGAGATDAGSPGAADATPQGGPDAGSADPDATPAAGVTLADCTGRAFSPDAPGEFRHLTSKIIALGSVQHAAADGLTTDGAAVTVAARFEYSELFKALEDEDVVVYYDDCTGWQQDGVERTDGEGRISHTFPPLGYGVYDVRYEVVGDATTVPAQLWVLPAGTHLAIYDIDGTLTTSDFELIKQFFYGLVAGTYTPVAYPGAAALTRAVEGANEVGVYLTGRPAWLTRPTRAWLEDLQFARGPLFLAPTDADAVPTQAGVGDFKLRTLTALAAQGFLLDWAHGNATTDIYAYLGAGLPGADVWIIGTHAGESGTEAVQGSWEARAAEVAALPPVVQPFHW